MEAAASVCSRLHLGISCASSRASSTSRCSSSCSPRGGARWKKARRITRPPNCTPRRSSGAVGRSRIWSSSRRVEVERLEELRLAAAEARIEAELALGRHAALIPELEALVGEYPLRERLRSQLMLALYRSGRQADALAAYRAGRSLLSDHLALEPSPALRELEQAILRQDPALEPGGATKRASTRVLA